MKITGEFQISYEAKRGTKILNDSDFVKYLHIEFDPNKMTVTINRNSIVIRSEKS